ncbi:replication factor C subunit, partial [Entamoeba invadens IP1]|uniref:replication factor C subunit n=1 Tax=Entamoeba invadens IP1 TaxID=370355 RepID=UPI0002C3F7AD
MAVGENEVQYIKSERFLKNKPTTMYPNPFRVQYFHGVCEGPHSNLGVYLNYFYDTNTVHMAPLNPLGSFYYQLDSLLEYHPHICVGDGYGALVLFQIITAGKYDGHSVLINIPLDFVKKNLVFPKSGRHVMVFSKDKGDANFSEIKRNICG